MKIHLVLNYVPPNPRNKRLHFIQMVKEKHRAQDSLMCALSSAASTYSTLTGNMEQSRICSMAFNTLDSYAATGRIRSRSKSDSKKSRTSQSKGRK